MRLQKESGAWGFCLVTVIPQSRFHPEPVKHQQQNRLMNQFLRHMLSGENLLQADSAGKRVLRPCMGGLAATERRRLYIEFNDTDIVIEEQAQPVPGKPQYLQINLPE